MRIFTRRKATLINGVSAKTKLGFSFAEMLVVVFILSLITAAIIPTIASHSKADITNPWKYASNNSDVYYGLTLNQTAIIGATSNSAGDLTKLIINVPDDTYNNILFKKANTQTGLLKIDSIGNVGLGNPTLNTTTGSSTALGNSAQALGASSLAIGYLSQATKDYNTAAGYNSQATGDKSIAIGSITQATGIQTIAIGYTAQALTDYSTAISYQAQSSSLNAGDNSNIAIGYQAKAIGTQCTTVGRGSMAWGQNTSPVGYATAFGYGAIGIGDYSVAVGASPTKAGSNYCVAIKYNYNSSTDPYAIGIYSSSIRGPLSSGNPDSVSLGGNASNPRAVALGGSPSSASGDTSLAMGVGARATGANSIAMSTYAVCTASGDSSIAIGNNNSSFVQGIGIGFVTQGLNYGTGLGGYSKANGDYSTALGYYSYATVNYSTTIGSNAAANTGTYNTAIGYNAKTTIANNFILGTATEKVKVPGNLDIAGTLTLGASPVILSGATWTNSDRRLKNINSEFTGGLDKIRQIQTYNYTLKSDKDKKPRVGVIAQELKKIFPHAVTQNPEKYLAIRQDDMFYAMLNSTKQLESIVQRIMNNIESLIEHIHGIDKKFKTLIRNDEINTKNIQDLQNETTLIKEDGKEFEARLTRLEKKIK